MRERTSRWVPLLAVALVLATGSAFSAEPVAVPAQAEDAAEKTYEPMTVLGMQVHIDPETGELRTPTPEEAAALSAQMQQMFGSAAAAEPELVYHKNGMISAELDFGSMDFSVVRIAGDGAPVFDCVDGAGAAAELAATPAPNSVGPEEE